MKDYNLETMSELSLQRLLQEELGKEGDLDISSIKSILKELEKRNPISVPNVEEEWSAFQANYLLRITNTNAVSNSENSSQSKHSILRKKRIRVLAVLVAILIVAFLTATAFATVNLRQQSLTGTWDDQVFHFALVDSEDYSAPVVAKARKFDSDISDSVSPELREFWEYTERYCTKKHLLPTWLPEQYKQVELFKTGDRSFVSASYQHEDDFITIGVRYDHDGDGAYYAKDATSPEIYHLGDYCYYILINGENYTAVWTDGFYEYYIISHDKECLYNMINSTQGSMQDAG